MKRPVFTGSATALVTPFTDRGVDYDRLAAAIDRQAEGGTAAIVVCGTTGEASTLSEAERASIIEFSSVCTRSRMKVIAGIGGNDTLAAANAAQFPRDSYQSVTTSYPTRGSKAAKAPIQPSTRVGGKTP